LEAGHWWLTSIILATQEAKIRRITFRSQPGGPISKNPSLKRAGGVVQGEGPEFKLHHRQKKRKERNELEISHCQK
jgi:hypothetical protein